MNIHYKPEINHIISDSDAIQIDSLFDIATFFFYDNDNIERRQFSQRTNKNPRNKANHLIKPQYVDGGAIITLNNPKRLECAENIGYGYGVSQRAFPISIQWITENLESIDRIVLGDTCTGITIKDSNQEAFDTIGNILSLERTNGLYIARCETIGIPKSYTHMLFEQILDQVKKQAWYVNFDDMSKPLISDITEIERTDIKESYDQRPTKPEIPYLKLVR